PGLPAPKPEPVAEFGLAFEGGEQASPRGSPAVALRRTARQGRSPAPARPGCPAPGRCGRPGKPACRAALGRWPDRGRPAPPGSRERLRRRWCVLRSWGLCIARAAQVRFAPLIAQRLPLVRLPPNHLEAR